MSSRRRTAAPPTPRRSLADVLRAGLTLDAPLTAATSEARREDPDHVWAMAVLAYTNHWDLFVNKHALNDRDYLRPFKDEKALRYANVVVFFLPFPMLKRLLERTETDPVLRGPEVVRLVPGPRVAGADPPACDLKLHIAGETAYFAARVTNLVAARLVMPAGVSHSPARDMWFAAVEAVKDALMGAMRPMRDWPPVPSELYRGLKINPGTTVPPVLLESSRRFVSATTSTDVMRKFAGNVSSANEPWGFVITYDQDVLVVPVVSVLPVQWQCYANEGEVIFAPGAYYTETSQVALQGGRTLYVRVSSQPPAPPGTYRPLPDDNVLLREAVSLVLPLGEPYRHPLYGPIATWNTSAVTDMRSVFQNAYNFTGNVEDWNVAQVTIMSRMFENAWRFNGDLSLWQTGNVQRMDKMFSNAGDFRNASLSNWDVSKVEDMSSMFEGAVSFRGLGLQRWVTSSVKRMNRMFEGAVNFIGPIGGWDVSNVRDMSRMFRYAIRFRSDLSAWDLSSEVDRTEMFEGAASYNAAGFDDVGSNAAADDDADNGLSDDDRAVRELTDEWLSLNAIFGTGWRR